MRALVQHIEQVRADRFGTQSISADLNDAALLSARCCQNGGEVQIVCGTTAARVRAYCIIASLLAVTSPTSD